MNEIFRIWNKKTNHMLYDSDFIYINSEGETVYIDWDNDNEVITLNNLKIMYYIGLKDKNKREIYNEDIMKYKDSYYLVKIIVADASDDMGMNMIGYMRDYEYMEIVGNSYENPELLNKVKK